MEISKRLQAVASLVQGKTIADIGTDHGYVPLYLWQNKQITRALACDINEGPLSRAQQNIKAYGAEHEIETRLGSGLLPVQKGEVETAIIAGMGGMLICRILHESPEVVQGLSEMVLSPQHDIQEVRQHIWQIGFCIDQEMIVQEDGKRYHILHCIPGTETNVSRAAFAYGGQLLAKKDPLLWEELMQEKKKYLSLKEKLAQSETQKASMRYMELLEHLDIIEEAEAWYK